MIVLSIHKSNNIGKNMFTNLQTNLLNSCSLHLNFTTINCMMSNIDDLK